MNWKINIIIFLIFSLACNQENNKTTETLEPNEDSVHFSALIEAFELKESLDNPHVRVLDFRASGEYEKEHIGGAINISRKDITNDSFPYGGIMASADQIEMLFSKLGIQNDDTIVIYDDQGLCEAARLWWILQNYNFTNIKLLHGGLTAWKEVNGITNNKMPLISPSEFRLPNQRSMKYYASKTDVVLAIENTTLILDTRSMDEFSGNMKKKGAFDAGKIPTSKNIDWAEAVNFNGDKKFKTAQELETLYSQIAPNKNDAIIVYCHSGVRSAHTTFVLTQLLDYKNVRNYDGSWIEWTYHNQLSLKED